MELPQISIIIPSYNKLNYLKSTLESIFAQKHPKLEVIIQDGGSTDGSIEIIRRYAKKYPLILKWESKKDHGQMDAINKGMKKAKGELLAYINADDIYLKGAFRKVADAYLKNKKALWFAGRGIVIDEKGRENTSLFYKYWVKLYKNFLLILNKYSLLLTVNYLMQPSIFITRAAYNKFGPFMGIRKFVMEYETWLKIGKYQMPYVINKDLSAFRITQTNITSTQSLDLLNEDWKIVKKYTKNPFVLFFHIINNLGRTLILYLIK